MGREEFELLKGGIVKRKTKRHMGLFIDATGLDRATRRLDRKVDLSRLVQGITSGAKLEVARYYALIPYEDDARQFAFLDAVERAGVEVITKRLPPKGVKRQVSMDVHIATDMVSFCHGAFANKASVKDEKAIANGSPLPTGAKPTSTLVSPDGEPLKSSETALIRPAAPDPNIKRMVTVVCPSREISYALYMCTQLGGETSLADFGLYGSSDGWKGVDRWVDLSTSETIWRG
jgi:hypothetical protein